MREIEQVMIYLSLEKLDDQIVWSLIISKTNQPTTFRKKKKQRIGLYDGLSTTTQLPQALKTPTYNTILNTPTYDTSLSSSININSSPTNNTNCLSSSINTSSLPTNNTNSSSLFYLRRRERYTNISSLFCSQRREHAINNLVHLHYSRLIEVSYYVISLITTNLTFFTLI